MLNRLTEKQKQYVELNKRKKLYYGTVRMPRANPVTKIYESMSGLNIDISNALKNGGVITDICVVSKIGAPFTEYNIEQSLKIL